VTFGVSRASPRSLAWRWRPATPQSPSWSAWPPPATATS